MKITHLLLGALALIAPGTANADSPEFSKHFSDSTLRVDYIFAGNVPDGQFIMLDGMTRQNIWAGRFHNLDVFAVRGDGQIIMTDYNSGDTIYCNPFNTLFQEWLTTDEANGPARSFENSFLLPLPLAKANIEVKLLDEYGNVTASYRHTADRADILIRDISTSNPTPHRVLHSAGSPADCIDVVIMAEGYTRDEMDTFYADAEIAMQSIFDHEPFKLMKDRFNIIAVGSESAQSGVSVPRFNQWRDTAFGSHFSTFYSNRYLTTPRVRDLHNALAGIPYEHIIILANTDEYGGGGIFNAYTLTTAHEESFRPVVVHEFGHSFGALADEYAYDHPDIIIVPENIDYESWRQNITSLVDFNSKWADMLPPDTPIPTPVTSDNPEEIGVYLGANYSTTSFYRPAPECRMRVNTAEVFCPVCRRALQRMIDFYTR